MPSEARPGGPHGHSAGTAALSVARRFGLDVHSARVLHDGSNVIVALDPLPLVARVAALTARVRMRPAEALGRDEALAGWLHSQGALVVPPSDLLPPGPHEQTGYGMTFWQPVEVSGTVTDADLTAQALFDLHLKLAYYEGTLTGSQPLISDALRGLALARDAGLVTREEASQLEAAGLRSGHEVPRGTFPMHGDAHPGNLLVTAGGPVWTDFEDTWRGPLEWDLACLHETRRLDGPAAVARYRELCATTFRVDSGILRACVRLRTWQRVCWSLIHATADPVHLPWARTALQEWLATS